MNDLYAKIECLVITTYTKALLPSSTIEMEYNLIQLVNLFELLLYYAVGKNSTYAQDQN
jgi:hypothetical protein